MLRLRHEGGPVLELGPVAPLANEGFVEKALGDDDVGESGHDRDIGAGFERQVEIGLGMHRVHGLGHARVEHDELGTLADALLHARGKDRMGRGGVGADHHDDIGVFDRIEILSAG